MRSGDVLDRGMPRAQESFFLYRLPHPEAGQWGVGVQGGGLCQVRAGEAYPPRGHPSDHSFDWNMGRALGAFQVVFISHGRGEFESQATGTQRVVAGMALMLFPGVWHRYRPEPESGWTEKWVEFTGLLPQRLAKAGLFAPERAVIPVASPADMESRMDVLHGLLRQEREGLEAELAAGAFGVLALLREPRAEGGEEGPMAAAILKARRVLEEAGEHGLKLPDLARSLGVSYPSFRREFRRRTGISPQQYQLRMRLQKVQRLLGGSDRSIKEIAEQLGFSSPYHLSSAFSSHFGLSPKEWRRQIRAGKSTNER